MLFSACILIFQFSLPSMRRDSLCQIGAVGLGESADELVFHCPLAGTVDRSAEALQSSLSWHLLSWSTQGPQEAAAKWAVICSRLYLLQSSSREPEKRIALGQVDNQHLSVPALSWSVATSELFDYEMVLVSKTVAIINSISLMKN